MGSSDKNLIEMIFNFIDTIVKYSVAPGKQRLIYSLGNIFIIAFAILFGYFTIACFGGIGEAGVLLPILGGIVCLVMAIMCVLMGFVCQCGLAIITLIAICKKKEIKFNLSAFIICLISVGFSVFAVITLVGMGS